VARSVNFNDDPAYVLKRSRQPSCKGDNPGVLKGVRSNTVNGYVMPKAAAKHFRAEGKYVVRQGDRNVMNGGNNPGIYVTMQLPSMSFSVAGANSDDESPPVQPETSAESDFLASQGDALAPSLGSMAETGKLLAMDAVAKASGVLPSPLAGFVPGKKG
jgi:uncharacterized protein (DUF1330 family)